MLDIIETQAELAIGPEWTIVEVVDDEVTCDGVVLRRAGVTATGPGGVAVSGSAAQRDGNPMPRAWSELLERACIVGASRGSRPLTLRDENGLRLGVLDVAEAFPTSDDASRNISRSNGVALAPDWTSACHRARRELVERDRVLRSWRGDIVPEPIAVPAAAIPPTHGYVWRAARIGADARWSSDVEVVVAVAFARDDAMPLLRGFGAAPSTDAALRHALGECMQSLAFLGPDDIPRDAPAPAPTPIYHLDLFLWPDSHAALRDFMDGHPIIGDGVAQTHGDEPARVTYVDLTPSWARDRFCVAQARCVAALPLVFGDACHRAGLAHPIA